MPAEQEYKKWGVADFERYHSGKMAEAEMHALEKAALDDPFLEDALEGYAFTKTPVADLAAIKEKLWPAADDVKTPVIWYRRKAIAQLFKAAAIVIIFGGLGWLIFNNTGDKKEEPNPAIAANNNESKAVAPLKDSVASYYNLNDTAPIIAKLDDKKVEEAIAQQPFKVTDAPAAQSAVKDYSADVPFEKEEMARNQSRAAEKVAIVPAPVSIQPALEGKVPGAEVRSKELAKQDSINTQNPRFFSNQVANATNQVRGRVVDNTGKPVPYATVRNNADRRQAVSADADGNFVLNNDMAANNVKIEVDAVGYQQANTLLNNNSANNTIVLNQSQSALSEVVITNAYKTKKSVADNNEANGYATKSRKEKYQWNGRNTMIRLSNARPLEGWDYFYYVMNDSITNNKALMQHKGKLTLEFSVSDSGKLQNVSVKKSLNATADSIAKAVLYKSPVLEVINKQKKGEAVIKINQ